LAEEQPECSSSHSLNEAVAPSEEVSESLYTQKKFQAGKIAECLSEWKQLTSDVFIINMVQGVEIPMENWNIETKPLPKNQVQGDQMRFLDSEVEKLLSLGVIEKSEHEEGEVISPVFLVKKPDGTFRLILNLKQFNENVVYEHFKMENLKSATQLMKENCFMASVDLRHAYYSVPVKPFFQKFLKFHWRGQLFSYTCLPNGLACCPRLFTKLLKPVYAHLRSQGLLSAAFIDDCYLQGQTVEECTKNVEKTVDIFSKLGFVIHEEKSVLVPCQKIKYLGVWLNSVDMTVSLTDEKKQNIRTACQGLKAKQSFSIRELAQVIGQLVAAFPAVFWGPLFYRDLEKLKISALKVHKGEFEGITRLNKQAEKELDWWIEEGVDSYYPLTFPEISVEMTTDASNLGYGATCQNKQTQGRWKKEEKSMHINCLELLAIQYALQSFQSEVNGKHVKILCDNTCAVSYVNKMGGSKSPECNKIAKEIWLWCRDNNVWVTISHIPGNMNVQADAKSRIFNDRTEWTLNKSVFQNICKKLYKPNIDLFASRLNYQVKPFISWTPDPEAFAIDAFTVNWKQWLIYAFPPFSLVQRCLRKLDGDVAEGVLIVPLWTTAVWFPQLLRLLIQLPVLLPRGKRLLTLPHVEKLHPLHSRLQLLACVCSGNPLKQKEFRDRLPKLFLHHGETQQENSMRHIWHDGYRFVTEGRLIHCVQL